MDSTYTARRRQNKTWTLDHENRLIGHLPTHLSCERFYLLRSTTDVWHNSSLEEAAMRKGRKRYRVMLNTKTLICETDANHFDRCILNTGILEDEVVVIGRLAGWVRCEQTKENFGYWFLMFIYPLYEIKKLKNEFRKRFAPTDIHFMCLCMHGHAAVNVIHRFTTYNDKSKFAIAFVINSNEEFEFSTSTKKKSTFEVIMIDSIVFLSGNVAPLCSDFHRWKRESLARLERYLSSEEKFCLGICEASEKNTEVIIIFEDEDGFDASAIELEQEITKLRNLTRRLHLTHNATATQSDEALPVIDLTESEDTDTLPNISETSTKSNQLETWESERKIKSRTSTNSELRHTTKNVESLSNTVTEQFEIFGSRRLSDNVSSGRQPQFLPTSFQLLNCIQFINMGIMIDCNSPQTEFRSRGAYDLEFDQFLANKDKK